MSAQTPEKAADSTDLEKQQQIADTDNAASSSKSSFVQPNDLQEERKPPPNPWMDSSSFPDGGATAWLTVAASAACFFVSWGWINCIGVFQDYFIRVPLREYSPSTVAWIPALETFFMLFVGPVVGYGFDHYGPRIVLLVGSVLHVFGLMMASISTEYYQFLLSQGVCSALGAACIFSCGIACVSTWFHKKRGMAIGIAASGSSLGGVLFPIIVSRMIDEVGFGWAMRTCAFIILGLMIFANIFLKSRIPPSKQPFDIMAFFRPLQELPMILLTLGLFFFYWGMFPVFSFITTVARGRGMSLQLSQYLVSILNAGSVFGRTLPGILGDKFGRFNVMTISCVLTTIMILAVWIPADNNAGQLVFAPIFGFTSGAAIALTPALVAQVSPIREIGVRNGLVVAAGSIGALTGSPIGGALISEDNGGFLYLQLFGGCVTLVGTLLFFFTRLKLGGLTWKKI